MPSGEFWMPLHQAILNAVGGTRHRALESVPRIWNGLQIRTSLPKPRPKTDGSMADQGLDPAWIGRKGTG